MTVMVKFIEDIGVLNLKKRGKPTGRDTLYIKLCRDDQNVGRKQNHSAHHVRQYACDC